MNNITRTIVTSIVKVKEVTLENGEVKTTDLEPLKAVNEKLTPERAKKLAAKVYGKGDYLVEVEYSEKLYGMALECFLEHAKELGARYEKKGGNN